MAESKTSCPKCAGHVAFPKEMAGQVAACPHCGESILLPKSKLPMAWLVAGICGFIIICLASALVWEHLPKKAAKNNRPVENQIANPAVSQSQPVARSQGETVEDSEDVQAMKNLCKDFYNAVNNHDAKALQDSMSASCRSALTTEDVKDLMDDNHKYEFIGLESVRFQNGALGKCGVANARRAIQGSGNIEEGRREFKFIKESEGWKLFRDQEIMDAIVRRFIKSGFTDQVKSNIKLLRDGDPFGAWDKNDTNALAVVFKLSKLSSWGKPIFPWDIQFTITSNKVDKYSIGLDFTVQNKSSQVWESTYLQFQLKRNGKVVSSGNASLQNVRSGQEIQSDTSFFLTDGLQDTSKFSLDVFYSLAGKDCPLVQDLPVEFKVRKLTELVKFEVVKKSFDITKSDSGDDMLVARVDYRVRNVGRDPLKQVQLKFVWSSLSGEIKDQTTEYVVGYGDLPLAPQQIKSGFVQCGKGYIGRRVPVKVDIYLEDDERHWPLITGLILQ
jgi:hypothetical protein